MALLHVLVRLVHVAGMGILLGGAAVLWVRLRVGADDGTELAAAYEWLFWAALGLVVLTGVGNLGAMAPAVPGPATRWGTTLAVKLVAVLGLLAGSLVRTLAVHRWRARGAPLGDTAAGGRLPAVYGATAGYLLVLVGLAEVLAHG